MKPTRLNRSKPMSRIEQAEEAEAIESPYSKFGPHTIAREMIQELAGDEAADNYWQEFEEGRI